MIVILGRYGICPWCKGGAHGVMVIIIGNGQEFKSWMRLIAFHIALILLGKV